ncbi:hypothetical protein MRX96_050670 [Rhipicephalus microplus]
MKLASRSVVYGRVRTLWRGLGSAFPQLGQGPACSATYKACLLGGASSARKQSGPLEQLAGWRSAKPRCRSTNNIRVAASSRTVEAASLVAAAQRAISWPVCAAGHAVCFGRVLISTESTLNRKFLAAPIFFCVTAHLRNCGGSSIWVPFGRMYLAAHQREQQLSLTCGRDCRPLLEERRQLGAAAACVSA